MLFYLHFFCSEQLSLFFQLPNVLKNTFASVMLCSLLIAPIVWVRLRLSFSICIWYLESRVLEWELCEGSDGWAVPQRLLLARLSLHLRLTLAKINARALPPSSLVQNAAGWAGKPACCVAFGAVATTWNPHQAAGQQEQQFCWKLMGAVLTSRPQSA